MKSTSSRTTAALSPEAAWERIEPLIEPLDSESVSRQQALGRVITQTLEATVDVPGVDVSAMDGYALSAGGEPDGPWPVVGTIAAGDAPGFDLPAASAAMIMTGAPVPGASDRVIPVELTDGGREVVTLVRDVDSGANIRRRAEVLAKGDPLLPPGTVVTSGSLALYATHGHAKIPVHRQPRVTILTTGDEVVTPETQPAPGQLRDSHTDFLLAAGASLGLRFESLGIAPDEPERLEALVRRGLEADVLLLGGGVSMGEFDLVENVLNRLGCEVLFDRVAIQPGKPLVAARTPGGLVFGLPGNPASVMACFWLFVRPALLRLQGHDTGFWTEALDAVLTEPLMGAPARDRFFSCCAETVDGQLRATPLTPIGSHDLAAWARGNSLVRVRAGSAPAAAGTRCQILPLSRWPMG